MYASHITPASSSPIKVVLKGDNLGLGASLKSAGDSDTRTGLDAFNGVLGRLNGKSERQLKHEEAVLSSFRRLEYLERRWGQVRFVSGGYLVGSDTASATKEKSSIRHNELSSEVVSAMVGRLSFPSHQFSISGTSAEGAIAQIKPSRTHAKQSQDRSRPAQSPPTTTSLGQQDQSKAERKAAKVAKRLKQRLDKERLQKGGILDKSAPREPISADAINPQNMAEEAGTGLACHATNTRSSPKMTPAFYGGRHAVRQRQIRHKKMSLMDNKALNEVRPHKDRMKHFWRG